MCFGIALFSRALNTGGRNGKGGGASRERMPAGGFYKQPVKTGEEGGAGSPRSCPVCGVLLDRGELVKSSVFPDPGNGTGRLMYIKGCVFCLSGRRPGKRKCPVCGAPLDTDEILFARMFNNSKRSHVHVLGCSRCRGPGKS